MAAYLLKRLLIFIPMIAAISVITFVIIQLPPGDYVDSEAARIEATGTPVPESTRRQMRHDAGLDRPVYVQYVSWIGRIVTRLDFGKSQMYGEPVRKVLIERVPATMVVSLMTILLIYAAGIPIGIFSAVRKYTIWDYSLTALGFIGLSVPAFLLALVAMWLLFKWFGFGAVGLFSAEYAGAPWSLGRVADLMRHVWLPVLILGFQGMASLIRVMRGNLMDELTKQYVTTARAKGLTRMQWLVRYPVRIALNPIASSIGWLLPMVVGGEILVSIVLNLETTGPVLLRAVLSQDMELAGSIMLALSVLTLLGTLVSDMLLAWLDPRIRLGGEAS